MNSRSSYFSQPSGREILTSKLEDLKRDHEKQMGDETKVSNVRSRSILITNLSINSKHTHYFCKVLSENKKAIRDTAEAMIKQMEAAHSERQMEQHNMITEEIERIERELKIAKEEEEQLKKFSEALVNLSNEIKTTEES